MPCKEFDSRVIKGFRIAPVKLNLKQESCAWSPGSYIVNAQGECNDCHCPAVAEGGDPFKGQPATNQYRGISGWRYAVRSRHHLAQPDAARTAGPRILPGINSFKAMRKGTDFKNRHPEDPPLLQVMPWPVYGKMNTLDLLAVYEYFKAIPSLPSPTS